MSRALGDHFLKQEKLGVIGEPSISDPIKLEPTDSVLIVASDGVRSKHVNDSIDFSCGM